VSLEPGPLPRRDPGAEMRAAARRTAESWRPWAAAWVGVGAVVFLMGAFVVLDYTFDQDPHRIFKVAVGLLALLAIATRPKFGLTVMPIVTPLVPWVPPTPIPGLNALNMLLFTIFGPFALFAVLQGKPLWRKGRLGLPIVVLLALAALSIVRGAAAPTGYVYDAGFAGLQLFRSTTTFATYFMVLAMARGPADRRRVAWAVLIGLLVESAVTAVYGRNGAGARAVGTLGQANELGGFLALFTVVAAAVAIGARRWYEKLAAAAAFGLGSFGIMLSLSRGSMVALIAGVVMVALRSARWAIVLLAVVLASSPLWLPDYVMDRITSSRVQVEGSDEATVDAASEARLETWRSILLVVSHHPLDGVGFTGLQYVLPDIGAELGLEDVRDSAHNTFLRMLSELGVLGLGCFVWLLIQCWRLGDSVIRAARWRFDRALGVGICGATVTMATSCAFGDRFFNPILASGFWILCALAEDSVIEAETPPEAAA